MWPTVSNIAAIMAQADTYVRRKTVSITLTRQISVSFGF